MPDFEFLSATDKPALLALNTAEYLATAQTVLGELGYKVHVAGIHEDFMTRFNQVQYQIVVIEELFSAATPAENTTLTNIQNMAMMLRRHCAFFLIGDNFQTLHPLQGFQQSVHAVINRSEIVSLGEVIQRVVADNDL